jgi:hypothetical protein
VTVLVLTAAVTRHALWWVKLVAGVSCMHRVGLVSLQALYLNRRLETTHSDEAIGAGMVTWTVICAATVLLVTVCVMTASHVKARIRHRRLSAIFQQADLHITKNCQVYVRSNGNDAAAIEARREYHRT